MKRRSIFLSTILIITVLIFVGCTKQQPNTKSEAVPLPSPGEVGQNQGITVNKINFEEVDVNTFDKQIVNKINQMKQQRGYYYLPTGDGGYYIFISAGEKKSGGYGIQVKSVEDNEGKTVIIVEETEPAKDEMVTMALTYPFTVIKASGITDNFIIEDEKGTAYKLIDPITNELDVTTSEGASGTMLRVDEGGVDPSKPIVGIYQGQIDSNSIEIDMDGTFMAFRTENVQDQLNGLQKGDKVEITFTVSPSDQFEATKINKIE